MNQNFERLSEHQNIENIMNLETITEDSLSTLITRVQNISDEKIFFMSDGEIIPKREYQRLIQVESDYNEIRERS